MKNTHILKNRFTGPKKRVNPGVGKSLGGGCLFTSQTSPHVTEGDAMSRKAGPGDCFSQILQGQLRHFINPQLFQEQAMNSFISLKNRIPNFLTCALFLGLLVAALFLPSALMASDGVLLKDEITAIEKLFTGGYMRLGLLGVCAFAAIYGIVNQSAWIFASGVLGCVFAYFMRDWITATFTLVI